MKERDSNIELLRIVATLFIIILHCNGWFLREWGGAQSWDAGSSIVAMCRVVIQNITVLGVDAFILISGFYGIRPKLKSIVNLFTLLFFFFVGCYLWNCGIGNEVFTGNGLLKNMMAFSRTNWFINSYLFLMLLAPLINAFVDAVNTRRLCLYTLIYSAATLYFGYYIHNYHWFYNEAYSVTMMVSVYLVGRCLNKTISQLEKIRYWHLICIFIGLIGLMSIIRVMSSNEEAWLHYGSPITIAAASVLFVLFYRLPKFKSKIVNWVGVSCLAAFVFHTCDPVFSWLIDKDVTYFMKDSYLFYCSKMTVIILGVFVSAILLDKVRLLIFKPIINVSGKIRLLN